MAELRHQMDENCEYLHHELNERGFKDCVRHFMKGECSHLKKLYANGGHQECPMGVERDEWEKLVEYWQGRETLKKAEIMASARIAVVTISSYGYAGKLPQAKLPRTLGAMEAHARVHGWWQQGTCCNQNHTNIGGGYVRSRTS